MTISGISTHDSWRNAELHAFADYISETYVNTRIPGVNTDGSWLNSLLPTFAD